ncbi:TIM-barrel domain-containing protein [Paenibacillus hemerocallicola]|uniref:TIM-barrel domain-containing protein n=1 Tax=Paenibacillus hemerocallicola TaxID=1172614 RepID=UPI00159ED22C|nr:TIM-barrel domain-containing protein [Paenibacillus hemerocallicola]
MYTATDPIQFRALNGNYVRVQLAAPHTFRIRTSSRNDFPEPPLNRYGILHSLQARSDYSANDEESELIVITSEAILRMDKRDGSFALLRSDGRILIRSADSTHLFTRGFDAQFRLSEGEKLYGLGDETRSGIQHRGHLADMRITPQQSRIPIPFLMSSGGWGMLVNTVWRHAIDIGHTVHDRLRVECEGGEPDFYLFAGDRYGQLLDRYTDIVGKPVLLPIWAYGLTFTCNQQADARDVVEDALNFRKEDIPCDTIGLEPGWMETYYDHSTEKRWHPERFSIPTWATRSSRTFMGALDRLGFKLSLWLCCNYDLSLYEERLLSGDTRTDDGQNEVWYAHLRKFVDQGVSAFKLDGSHMPVARPNRKWANGMSSEEIHNLYPLLLFKQMQAGYREQTGRRAMIYSMIGYTGLQQYAATWAGTSGGGVDSLVSLLNHSLSGHAHTTCDMEPHSAAGIHFGFLQPWSHLNNFAYWQHPSLLDPELLHLFRMYAKLRYSLIPYIYSAAHVAARTGMPILRAMPLCFPDDARTDEMQNQYMLGDSLLVAAFTDTVYLPEGTWIDYWTNERHVGPKEFLYTAPEHAGGPLFARAGSIIPVWPETSSVGQSMPERIGLRIYPHASGDYALYEDDGVTYGYLDGQFSETNLCIRAEDGNAVILIEPRTGQFCGIPGQRGYDLYVYMEAKPLRLSVNGRPLAEWTGEPGKYPADEGWHFERDTWLVHAFVMEAPESRDALRIELISDASAANPRLAKRKDAMPDDRMIGPGGHARATVGTWENKLEISLISGNLPKAQEALQSIWSSRPDIAGSSNQTREYLLNIGGVLLHIAERQGWRLEEVAGDDYNDLLNLPGMTLSEGTYSLLWRVLQRFIDYSGTARTASTPILVKQVIALVEQEIDRELTLQHIAERLHVNSSHLSRVFKRELGKPFSVFLSEKKMLQAKQMLLAGERISDVSVALGYKDSSHFSRVFRKYWGTTPGELIAPLKKKKTTR